MIDQVLIDRVTQLPAKERLTLIELLTRSLRKEFSDEAATPSPAPTTNLEEIERLARSFNLTLPPDSSLWRLLGIAASNGPAPTDEELKADYIDYLERKYS